MKTECYKAVSNVSSIFVCQHNVVVVVVVVVVLAAAAEVIEKNSLSANHE